MNGWQERLDDRLGGVEFRFSPMPWNWRMSWYKDEFTPFWWVHFGPFAVLLSINFLDCMGCTDWSARRTREAPHNGRDGL